jgi:hypothetical protein
VPLPGWGHGSPVAVGGKVFVMCEPDMSHDFPYLLCLNGDDGTVVWTRDLDHVDLLTPDAKKRDAIRADWKLVRAFTLLKYRFRHALATATDKDAVKAEYAAKGLNMATLGDNMAPADPAALDAAKKRLRAYGITPEGWHDGLTRGIDCVGMAYATPVSDGKRVFATTAHGGHFCFDLDGTPAWSVAYPGDVPKGRGDDYCQMGRSPILYHDLLISTQSNLVRAIDKATGALRWKSDAPDKAGAHTIVSPAVLTVGGVDVLWTAGPCAFRLPNGQPLTIDGWKDEGLQILVRDDERDVAFFCGCGEHCGWTGKGKAPVQPPAAVRFALEGGTLKATVLWHGGTGTDATPTGYTAMMGGTAPWMLYHDGKLYHRGGVILDALTGKVLSGSLTDKAKRAVPDTRHLLLFANGNVFGLTRAAANQGGGAVMPVYTADGKFVAANRLPMPKLAPEQEEVAIAAGWAGGNDAGEWTKGYTFTFAGDRIYIRSMMHLICIGKNEVKP